MTDKCVMFFTDNAADIINKQTFQASEYNGVDQGFSVKLKKKTHGEVPNYGTSYPARNCRQDELV